MTERLKSSTYILLQYNLLNNTAKVTNFVGVD
ncbi:MAG: Unknown protein [uncultured Aureispira sp.]|uniref:Uncharacterized protein n=1 Tax=uncultured Aureispira sp. TaxID=1331704 RepID=A0A6S6UEW1_9BACT|nr:MAG: Unknown protein [uncultured Aureispira sp.]